MTDLTKFNPSQHRGQYSQGETLPSGIYVLWCKTFKRQVKNGKEQILLVIEAIGTSSGQKIKRNKYDAVFETITLTDEALWRFAQFCEAIGQVEMFNVLSDSELSSVIKRKPFKAKVKWQTYRGQTSPRIDSYVPMTTEDEKLAEEVLEDLYLSESQNGGGTYDDASVRGVGDSCRSSRNGVGSDSFDSNDFADDDIPF